MKRILFAFIVLFTFNAATAQTAQKATWPEMKAFHGVMSTTFHPSEDNNLKPLRDSAMVLLTKAREWQASPVPKGYKADVTKPILQKLVEQCENIYKAVANNKTDGELKEMITKAHDTFHEIMEKCREEGH